MIKLFTVCIITNCGKLLKRWEYKTIFSVYWESCMQVKKQQLETCIKELTSSRLRKEWEKAVYWHPVHSDLQSEHIVWNASLDGLQAGIKISERNISNLRYVDCQKDILEKEMVTHSSILAWKILWTEEPGGLQSMWFQRVRHDWVTSLSLSFSLMAERKEELKSHLIWVKEECEKASLKLIIKKKKT